MELLLGNSKSESDIFIQVSFMVFIHKNMGQYALKFIGMTIFWDYNYEWNDFGESSFELKRIKYALTISVLD